MCREWRRFVVAILLLGVWGARLVALDTPWRPIPDLPSLLWHTEFDENAEEFKKLYSNGKPKLGKPAAEGDNCIALGTGRWGTSDREKRVDFSVELAATKLRMPDKLNPSQIFVQFQIWTNEPGKIGVMVRTGQEYWDYPTVPKTDAWSVIKFPLAQLANKGDRIKVDSNAAELRFSFKPARAGDKLPEVYIDKVIITYQTPPEQIAMRLMAWQAKMGKMSKSPETDGFCYDDKMHTNIQKLAAQANHRGPVLVFLPAAPGNGEPAAQWNAAATEAKLRSAKFEVAQDPRKLPLSGMDDARAFLPYLLEKTDPQAVMLIVTKGDGVRAGKEVGSLRLILMRLLTANCIPLVCLPAPNETDGKLTEFIKAAQKVCDELAVPWADQGFAFKGLTKPYADDTLTDEGQKAVCTLLVAAYKHVQEALNPRR